jgi:hypothetical protein
MVQFVFYRWRIGHGDLGQRIFQQPFSWKAIGVDIRGRSRTLRINYRTSHQIRMQADRLLGPELSFKLLPVDFGRLTFEIHYFSMHGKYKDHIAWCISGGIER